MTWCPLLPGYRVQQVEMTKVLVKSIDQGAQSVKLQQTVDLVQKKNNKNANQTKGTQNRYLCKRCDTTHEFWKCPAFGKECRNCGKPNHFSVSCQSGSRTNKEVAIVEKLKSDEELNQLFGVNEISLQNQWLEIIKIENINVTFKVDMGSQVNLLPDKIFKMLKCINSIGTPILG